MKRETVILEDLGVNMSHDHEEEAEVYDIPPPSLHPWTTPHLGYHYVIFLQKTHFYLFDYILTPPLCNLHHNRSLIKLGQIANLSPQVEEDILEGFII